MLVIVGSKVAFECMISELATPGWPSASGSSLLNQNDCRVMPPIFDELSEAIPGVILKAA
jgi:hypothetical protein